MLPLSERPIQRYPLYYPNALLYMTQNRQRTLSKRSFKSQTTSVWGKTKRIQMSPTRIELPEVLSKQLQN